LQIAFLIWLVAAATVFTFSLAMTPPDSITGSEVFWLALLAGLWPFIVAFSAIGILLTLLASLTHTGK
jgi:hypothetical protein